MPVSILFGSVRLGVTFTFERFEESCGGPRVGYVYNSPPNWPKPPEGWRPPEGWAADPAWGPPPPDWQFWIWADETPTPAAPAATTPAAPTDAASPYRTSAASHPTPAPYPTAPYPTAVQAPPPRRRSGITWILAGGAALFGLVLILVVVAALGGAGDDPESQNAAATASRNAEEREAEASASAEASARAEASASAEASAAAAAAAAEEQRRAEEEQRRAEEEQRRAAEQAALQDPASYAAISDRDYALVVRDPDSFIGKKYVLFGVVTQFDAATGIDTFLANTSATNQASWWDYDTNTMITTDNPPLIAPVVEDDIVQMYVEVLGSFSYDTQIGGNTTVPLFKVNMIQVIGSSD